MKVRIKYSNTQKFIVTLENEDPLLLQLNEKVKSFIESNYGEERTTITLSFNGKEPIKGTVNDTLSSLGIVNGDLLIVLKSVEPNNSSPIKTLPSVAMETSSSSSSSRRLRTYHKISSMLEALEGEPPQSVVDAFNRYEPSSANFAMNLLIHLAIIERGFYIDDGNQTQSIALPPNWKDMVATLKYYHPGLNDFKCTIAIVTMGDVKQVLASFEGQQTEISVRLETINFVPSNQILPHRLLKLALLAKTIRNELLHPLHVAAHHTLGLPAPWHLAGLPQEVLVGIIRLLPLKDVLTLSISCKRLNLASCDNKLWFLLFKRDFKDESHSSDTISGSDWRAKYKKLYLLKKKERIPKRTPEIHPYVPPPELPYIPQFPGVNPMNPFMPQPRAPNPYPPNPDPYPNPNPYYDPDSPYFGGEIPPMPGPFFPMLPNPLGGRPRRPQNPMHPFMPPNPRNPRGGPRFDYI